MEDPTIEHLKSTKRILRYVKGTLELGLKYKQGDKFVSEGYKYRNYGGDSEERKSTSGFLFSWQKYSDIGVTEAEDCCVILV